MCWCDPNKRTPNCGAINCIPPTGVEHAGPTTPAGPYQANLERALPDLKRRFTYHPPQPGQPERYTRLRLDGHDLAQLIVVTTPSGREQALALTKLEEAIFWSNAAIARGEP